MQQTRRCSSFPDLGHFEGLAVSWGWGGGGVELLLPLEQRSTGSSSFQLAHPVLAMVVTCLDVVPASRLSGIMLAGPCA